LGLFQTDDDLGSFSLDEYGAIGLHGAFHQSPTVEKNLKHQKVGRAPTLVT
jgi:hypothetical protein